MAVPPGSLAGSVAEPLPDLATSVVLVHRARGGDRGALDDLLGRYRGRLLRIVRIRMGAGLARLVDPEDVVQETLAAAANRVTDFEPASHASILHWLAAIAQNKVGDAHGREFAQKRDRGRERPLSSPQAEGSEAELRFEADITAPEDRASRNELRTLVDGAIAELPDDYREVIILRDYEAGDWEWVTEHMSGDRSRHACQELHRRAWIRLGSLVRGRLGDA